MTRIAIRGFIGDEKQFEDRLDADTVDLAALARKHAEAMIQPGYPHMIEVEFLDEPNPLERFFRFGTDPRLMVAPIGIDLRRPDDGSNDAKAPGHNPGT